MQKNFSKGVEKSKTEYWCWLFIVFHKYHNLQTKYKYIMIIYNNKYNNYGGNGRKASKARNDHSLTDKEAKKCR